MDVKRELDELRTAAMWTLAMSALAFALPALCFGGGVGEIGTGAQSAPQAAAPAVLEPLGAAAEPAPLPSVPAGERDGSWAVTVLDGEGQTREMDMASYLWGVVAAEMPASFEEEALKAQAAAARTYTLWKSLHTSPHPQADVCTDHTCCQAWRTREEAAEAWGEDAAAYAAKIAAAVAATDGMVLCWEGEPIQAVYHSSSPGRTEDAVAVWGTEVPYLVGVDTPEGEGVPNYVTTVILTPEEVAEALTSLGCAPEGDPSGWFSSLYHTARGGVTAAVVGGGTVSGSALRTVLGLRSTSFTVDYDGAFTFTVTGYGHGVGMSQYGANALAKEGKSWEEIVSWYYTGASARLWQG